MMRKILNKIENFYFKFRIHGFKKILRYSLSASHSLLWAQPIRGSYSQKGEDLIIDGLLNNKKKGFYIDIGAHDPSLRSNTKRFYKKGWSGINVEPDYNNYCKFIKNRPRDMNLNIGVSDKDRTLNFYRFIPDAISTFSKENLAEYKRYGFKLREKIRVPTRKLSKVFSQYVKNKIIDFMSVDAEGYDLKVLKSNDWGKFRPTLICVETHYHYNNRNVFEETREIYKLLTKVGYDRVWANNINEIYQDKYGRNKSLI